MSKELTFLLSRAVPDVCVWRVEVVKSLVPVRIFRGLKRMCFKTGVSYSFDVRPEPYLYWRRFKEIYPRWRRLAFKCGQRHSVVICELCPEFASRSMLIEWLSDVLDLSQGERNLLRLVGVG